MHQHPRPSPRSATPASNLATNPERTNNSRDPPPRRSRSSIDLASYTERAGGGVEAMAGTAQAGRSDGPAASAQEKDQTRLNQIIQNFHTKAALTICSARAHLPQVQTKTGDIKQNRWFNIILDETDVLIDDLREWKRLDLTDDRPQPLVIETFIDTTHLINNQVLVLVDASGKRWDVADALGSSAHSSPRPTKNGGKHCEVVLERWTVELGDPSGHTREELGDILPNVYKKGVVLFRSLYSVLRLLPAWKLHRKSGRQASNNQVVRLRFRIKQGTSLVYSQKDSLSTPLCPEEHGSSDIVGRHEFQSLLTPAGPLRCTLEYRQNCGFGVADSESLLSSRFLGLDEGLRAIPAGHSLPIAGSGQTRSRYSSTMAPTTTTTMARERPRALLGAYGSLGTFHAAEKRNSPVSELRQRALDDEEDTQRMDESEVRRPASVNFVENPPFKAGSFASSTRPSPYPSPSPGTSAGKYDGSFLKLAGTPPVGGKRISLNALPQQQLRAPPIPNETAVASSGSSSPKPAPVRYSSSFANRQRRFTSQSSKAGESNASSGRGSSSSKEKSGQFNESGTTPGSSGSGHPTDEDDIASYISELEKAKDKDIRFRSPPSPSSGISSTTAATASTARESQQQPHYVVNLAKYSSIRDPTTQLAEEMSSSSLFQTSVTPPSRRLSNVPGLSTSSSPLRAVAHTPHVRSRLSTHSIVEEGAGVSGLPGVEGAEEDGAKIEGSEEQEDIGEEEEDEDEDEDEPFIFPQDNV